MAKNPEISKEALQNTLGSAFEIRPGRQGSFQVNLANLRGYDNDYDKMRTICAGYDALVAAGYEVNKRDCKCAQPRGENVWISWLCVWVNPPRAATTDVDGALVDAFSKAESLGISMDDLPSADSGPHRQLAFLRQRIAKHDLSTVDGDGDTVSEGDDIPF